jgi:hypothetical protein
MVAAFGGKPNCNALSTCATNTANPLQQGLTNAFTQPQSCANYILFCETQDDAIFFKVTPTSQSMYLTPITYQIIVTEQANFNTLSLTPQVFSATNFNAAWGFYKVSTPRPWSVRVAGIVSDDATKTQSGQYVQMQVWPQPCRGYTKTVVSVCVGLTRLCLSYHVVTVSVEWWLFHV